MSKILPLLASLLLSVPLLHADPAEDKAIAGIKKLGGDVQRDKDDPAHPVVAIYLISSKVTDASLKQVAAFKDLTGVSRKYAIPLLEYLDRERVTRRVGDVREIL